MSLPKKMFRDLKRGGGAKKIHPYVEIHITIPVKKSIRLRCDKTRKKNLSPFPPPFILSPHEMKEEIETTHFEHTLRF